MKLIIDIPKWLYNRPSKGLAVSQLESAILHGIPLEQIRDEIESHIIDLNGLDFNSALYIASEIINNYIKEQTNETDN